MDSKSNTSQLLTSRIIEVFLHENLSAMFVVLSLIAGYDGFALRRMAG